MRRLSEPEWISPPNRFGVGIRFRCPTHDVCWVKLYFRNPVDGGEPEAPLGAVLYRQHGAGLGGVSLFPPCELGECGTFWVLYGHLLMQTD
ncbi:MAG: hypothetical protein ACREXY_15505 [Gammaproteobacteria bacterium]